MTPGRERGFGTSSPWSVSVTFFPACVTMARGLRLVPGAAFDLTRVHGASRLQELYMVAIPSALPCVLAATRLAVPRAPLGVMIAEWPATGVGLGSLLDQSRGYLDYSIKGSFLDEPAGRVHLERIDRAVAADG